MSAESTVPRGARLNLLAGLAGLGALPVDARVSLAGLLEEGRHAEGDTVVREGEVAERVFFVVEGRLQIWTEGQWGPVAVASLGPGEMFGELGLLMPDSPRLVTVSCLTEAVTLSLPVERLRHFLAGYPEATTELESHAMELAVLRFIGEVGPLSLLDEDGRRALAGRMETVRVEPGEEIVREGERGDTCYFIRAGRAEVIRGSGADASVVDVIGAGTFFGESALLSDAARTATVRAVEPCVLLALPRSELLEAMSSNSRVADRVVDMFRVRERPQRLEGIVFEHRSNSRGEPIAILKDPRRLTYYRLSGLGMFVWERLDGRHNVRELALEYQHERGVFAPHAVADVVAGLQAAGFVSLSPIQGDVPRAGSVGLGVFDRAAAGARRVLEWQVSWTGIDPWLTRAYERVLRPLFTRPAQLVSAALAVAGVVAFVAGAHDVGGVLAGTSLPLLAVLPASLVGVVVHEVGHALATKACGREVTRVGIGWYWYGPMAFVDTSDMWLASRRERILVSAAGPYAHALFAGALAIVALIVDASASVWLWTAALALYVPVLLNLNPLLELDGYYILSDLLDRPNLRRRALEWIGAELPRALRDHRRVRGHWVDLIYGLASLLYVLATGVLVFVLYRVSLGHVLDRVIGDDAARAIGWTFAITTVTLTVVTSIGDLRLGRNRRWS